ncbi:MAG: hypothetical protein HPY76_02680 [Anaerolineae bacterium]|nr:hypothetical protein [Anaerolineae bacterium]
MPETADLSMELRFTEAYRRHYHAPIAIREAMCLREQFPSVLTAIQPGDLLAGRIQWGLVGFSPHNNPPESGYGYYCDERKIIRALEKSSVPFDQRERGFDMLHFWKKETSQALVEAAFDDRMKPYLFRDELEPLPFNYKPMVAQPIYRMAGVFVNYTKLLNLGIPGLVEELQSHQKAALDNGQDASLYEGMLIALQVFADSCQYYARHAQELADHAAEPAAKAGLQQISICLQNISCQPPETFREALQMSWLYTLMCGTLEMGRMDVYLGDFYVRDLERGILTKDDALALMRSLWRLINDQFREVDGRVIIGGRGRPNEANADRFALLAMETARTYGRAILPQLTLRFYKGMNPLLMEKATELIGEGHTYPLLYNDDVLIPSVQFAHDVPLEDAEQYVPLGCGEIVIDHMGFGTPSGALNMLKALEITLHNGRDPITGKQMGLQTGEFHDFRSFDDLWEAYKEQLRLFIEVLADHEELEYVITGKTAPYLFLSMLYDDCLPRNLGIFDGGVRYLGGSLESYGNVNAADSLTAIRQLVYDEKRFTPEQMLQALHANFEGFEHERRMMLDCPKYGNDDPDADGMLVELHNFLCNTIRDQRQRTNLHWYLDVIINNSQNTTLARWVGASADGRKAGMPMANANTPSGGSDKKGVTALLNSVVKPSPAIHAGAVQNIRFGRDLFTNQREKFDAILGTYFDKGGCQLMVTVINRGDLERALEQPEAYRDLFVRVGGFSARFVDLPRDVQVEILSRTTY